jgi:hypothetical protein
LRYNNVRDYGKGGCRDVDRINLLSAILVGLVDSVIIENMNLARVAAPDQIAALKGLVGSPDAVLSEGQRGARYSS